MNKFLPLIQLVFILVLCFKQVSGQNYPPAYNLNQNNGLPIGFVYHFIVDHYGYLWIATPRGVARYNGYELKLFGLDNGLPYEDIWSLIEDKSGRIWLSSVHNEIGYIKYGRYRTAIEDTQRIYPLYLQRFKDGIIFMNKEKMNLRSHHIECIIYTSGKISKYDVRYNHIVEAFLDEKFRLIVKSYDKIHSTILGVANKWEFLRNVDTGEVKKKMDYNGCYLFRDYFYDFDRNKNKLWVFNFTKSGDSIYDISPIKERKGKIVYVHPLDGKLFVLGSKRAYILDSTLRVIDTYSIPEITNGEKQEENLPYMVNKDPFWGTLAATKDKGLYISTDDEIKFTKETKLNLNGFRYAGRINDSSGYWWNNTDHTLVLVGKQAIIKRYTFSHLFDVQKITPFVTGLALVVSSSGIYWLSEKTGKLTSFFANDSGNRHKKSIGAGLRSAIAVDSSSLYCIHPVGHTLVKLSPAITSTAQYINGMHGYYHIVYDKSRKGLWLYSDRSLGFYNIPKNTIKTWNQAELKEIGLKKIEYLYVDDTYGNIFVKERENIYLFDPDRKGVTPICPEYIYSDCFLAVQDNKLTISGRFGLLQLAITGKGKLERAIFFQNIKSLNYNTVHNMQVFNDQVRLKTDKGIYKIKLRLPYLQRVYSNQSGAYRFILSIGDTAKLVRSIDTIVLDPHHPVIQFDAVNPRGNGTLMFEYRQKDNKGWLPMMNNELNFIGVSNKKLTVFFRAKDAVSRSRPHELIIYIKPYWWQSTNNIIGFALLFISLVITIASITRRILLRRFKQKQLLAELALKGVHAQINPHFIYNTLTSAQYFIRSNKPQEAYNHINRFSKILRNFLSASKHKYITIQDEINNLNEYIALQQTRFVDKFDYKLYIAPTVNIQLKIPSLLLQPLVENAIVHGLNNKNNKGNLLISFTWENDLHIFIEDDGIGRKRAMEMQNQSALKIESHGSELLKRLLHIFNRYENTKISVNYIDKKPPESGTIVHITIHNPPV